MLLVLKKKVSTHFAFSLAFFKPCDLLLKCSLDVFCFLSYLGFFRALHTHGHTQMTQEGVGQ